VTFRRSRGLFLRLIGGVYLIAFVSLAAQITGLAGEHGILPVGEFLARAHDAYGAQAYYAWPTLLWFSPSDACLSLLCWSGAAVSLLLVAGIAPVVSTALLWGLYLSVTIAGQDFLQFQWDALLLETGLLAILYAPVAWRSRLVTDPEPPAIVRWALWGLAFKLTFLSGITKILSGDPTWANWTALTYHYETQPIPTWTSWYMHQLPPSVHFWSAAGMFVIEVAVPWLIFAPPRFARVRLTAAALMISLQLGIGATGNYGFFNLLAIVLYLALLDDGTLERVHLWRRPSPEAGLKTRGHEEPLRSPQAGLTARGHEEPPPSPQAGPKTRGRDGRPQGPTGGAAIWHLLASGAALAIAVLSAMTMFREIDTTWGRPGPLRYTWSGSALGLVSPLDSINGYGLFRVMTTERPEIVIEVSADGTAWKEYEFKWKAGDVRRRPRFVEPHMPRLDWQMWFAALDPRSAQRWLAPLVQRLLEGDEAVTRLLGPSPIAGRVHCARLVYYQYHFTTRQERAVSGAWWKRERAGDLTNVICR